MKSPVEPSVAILMATFNGAAYIDQQLASIAAQSYGGWTLWVSDDGSSDDTLLRLRSFAGVRADGQVVVRQGPAAGVVANFLSLLQLAEIDAAYYAYADQDDVWHADKLARALAWLDQQDPEVPALYCSRTVLVDADDRVIGESPRFGRAPTFANALVQNIAGGNTMVFNRAARRLLSLTDNEAAPVLHDWWVYLVVSACKGTVFFDPKPTLRYRQHGANLIGSNVGWRARLTRISKALGGRTTQWNDRNIAALAPLRGSMSESALATLDKFERARRAAGVLRRLAGLRRSAVYRQSIWGDLSLWIAAALGRL
ncbi:glycosyltransferase family 2 protein [Niveibacterium umoris]